MEKNKVEQLTSLRALACLFVVICHSFVPLMKLETAIDTSSIYSSISDKLAYIGVNTFFIISGFIMYHVHKNDFGRDGVNFIKKRMIRIIPSYYVVLTITIIAARLIPKSFPTTEVSISKIILSLLFVPAYYSEQIEKYSTIVSVSWTLCYEVFFYLVFFVALKFKRKIGLLIIYTTIIALFFVGLVWDFDKRSLLSFYTSPVILFFIVGVSIAIIYDQYCFTKNSVFFLFSALCFFTAYVSNSDVIKFVSVSMFLFFFLMANSIKVNLLSIIGHGSYSIYLTHRLTIGAVSVIINKLRLESLYDNPIVLISAYSLMSILVGILFYNLIEKRAISYLRSKYLT